MHNNYTFKQFIKELLIASAFIFVFWAFYWTFWIVFEQPHYQAQEELFKEQMELLK